MRYLRLDARCNSKDKDWVEKTLGGSAEIDKHHRRRVRAPEGEEPPYPKGFWTSSARADTSTLRDPSFFHSTSLEVGGTYVAKR